MLRKFALTIVGAIAFGAANAEPVRVVTDILPVHSLVSQVFAGMSEPQLLLPPGTSPHDTALRPSAAAALEDAQLVYWVGPELTPQLERSLSTLAEGAITTALLDLPETQVLSFREEPGDHSEEDDDDHDGVDPHAWLNPENAIIWLAEIAKSAAELDPDNRDVYGQNAKDGIAAIRAAQDRASALLAGARGKSFLTYHDALQYFEVAFDVTSSGSITDSDATEPSVSSFQNTATTIAQSDAVCLFLEPGANEKLAQAAAGNLPLKLAEIDLLGSSIEPGPALYPLLIETLATNMAECLMENPR